MKKKTAASLLIKLVVFAIPFIGILIYYIAFDPFEVIYKYNSYYKSGQNVNVPLNEDYVSTQNFINKKGSYNYDSFIFGNSRSRFYEVNDWKKYIHCNECYHFNALKESLYGMLKKIEFLHNNKIRIKNALFITDASSLMVVEKSSGHMYIKHPATSGENYFSFQFNFFKSFLYPAFLIAYTDLKISHKIKPYMKESLVLEDTPMEYDSVTNQVHLGFYERIIDSNRESYYKPRASIFNMYSDTVEQYSPAVIGDKQIEMLKTIRKIFSEDSTNYQIVISPLYYKVKLNPKDLEILCSIFGKEKVHDYSGVNDITKNRYNYYEESHYRPFVAARIMQEIYK